MSKQDTHQISDKISETSNKMLDNTHNFANFANYKTMKINEVKNVETNKPLVVHSSGLLMQDVKAPSVVIIGHECKDVDGYLQKMKRLEEIVTKARSGLPLNRRVCAKLGRSTTLVFLTKDEDGICRDGSLSVSGESFQFWWESEEAFDSDLKTGGICVLAMRKTNPDSSAPVCLQPFYD
jgi:hypothetical protein